MDCGDTKVSKLLEELIVEGSEMEKDRHIRHRNTQIRNSQVQNRLQNYNITLARQDFSEIK